MRKQWGYGLTAQVRLERKVRFRRGKHQGCYSGGLPTHPVGVQAVPTAGCQEAHLIPTNSKQFSSKCLEQK